MLHTGVYTGTGTRPQTTAHMAVTMGLLNLTALELREKIEKELAENPAMELVEERRCPTCHRLLPGGSVCPVCSRPNSVDSNEPVVFISPRDDFFPKSDRSGEDEPEDPYSSIEEDLPTYVLRQISSDLAPQDRIIAAFLLTNLDEDGLLKTTLLEVARYYHVPLPRVENIQRLIMLSDPVGVGATSVQQALLVQLQVLAETQVVPDLASCIIEDGMDLFSRHQYAELAKQYKTTIRQVQQVVNFISNNLYPFPARAHWGDSRQATNSNGGTQVYRQPDIIISHLNDDPQNTLVVEIIMPIAGTLRINPLFKKAVQEAPEDKREDWKGDIERASLFVKCLQQRNHTMERLMQRVASLQKPFIISGEKYLIPVTRAQISKELLVHESTISRAVASKCVQLPNKRIIPLSSFFNRSLNVRSVLREIVQDEKRPLSDTELADLLAERGFNVARRTVAKYRSMEGILPAHLRHISRCQA